MVKNETSANEIAEHLQNIERDTMGLTVTAKSFEHDKKIASLLLEHKEWVDSKTE